MHLHGLLLAIFLPFCSTFAPSTLLPTSRQFSASIQPAAHQSSPTQLHVSDTITQYANFKPASSSPYFISPPMNTSKQTLLFLPGLDGTGLSASDQFEDLSHAFDFHRFVIPNNDRSSFISLRRQVVTFLRDYPGTILVGESFGGLLASSVGITPKLDLSGLVLVNPATSTGRTDWGVSIPLITSLLKNQSDVIYPATAAAILGLTVPSNYQITKIAKSVFSDFIESPSIPDLEDLKTVRDGINDLLPSETVFFRVSELLRYGNEIMTSTRLKRLSKTPTLVLVGAEDKLLPSKAEGAILKDLLGENCTVKSFPKGSHFLLDGQVNLTQQIRTNFNKKYDAVKDFELPTEEAQRRYIEENIAPIRKKQSPKFYSTNSNNNVIGNLNYLPTPKDSGRPVLFVGNHQFLGLDVKLVVAEILEKRGFLVRGLGHPIIFGGGGPNSANNNNNFNNDFIEYGTVKVSPTNYYKLMKSGQAMLLFPGGVSEVFHGRDEAYQLKWSEKNDFVRTAIKFNATIVTLASAGSFESYNIVKDAKELLDLPFVGSRLANFSASVQGPRAGVNETFVPPLAIPKKQAARHYFLFGKPIETEGRDYKDLEGCSEVYKDVKNQLETDLKRLVDAREEDIYSEGGKVGKKRVKEETWGGTVGGLNVDTL
ncbi:hypothetical protein TrLO_g2786 [Triparma laevis f. longispina]|uniref:Serine aminopeptidase S33 domain-containing protein n=1 Tax=Triparma laevis f. longispina TaxID=1714387 RepID=A0A9W7FSL4_9STRA|nr:hypothetical protein TrLO_g2786 [Triparma laevis f. longispina]